MPTPELDKFQLEHAGVQVVMISRVKPNENRTKVKEPRPAVEVLLQQRWKISRRYAMSATLIAYLIDEVGIIAHGVAMGAEVILGIAKAERPWTRIALPRMKARSTDGSSEKANGFLHSPCVI